MSKEKLDHKPTEIAQMLFSRAANTAFNGFAPRGSQKGISPADLAMVLQSIAGGLEQIAIGLRATYMQGEEILQILKDVRFGITQLMMK
jgi:hypothetical protein